MFSLVQENISRDNPVYDLTLLARRGGNHIKEILIVLESHKSFV